jgi:hypothetical protein
MGEAKTKGKVREKILAVYPWCIYCGAQATTTDHCPPRAAFRGRHWPESYEFPACSPCNAGARRDEQVLAVLFRSDFADGNSAEQEEWEKQAQGLKNTQPEIVAEWQPPSRNRLRKILRLAYGAEADERRRRGWGAIVLGPLTEAVIQRFMIKLSKALYFKHNQHAFDGVLYTHQVDKLRADTTPEYLAEIYRMAPGLPEVNRNSKSLFDQFIYRFNHSPEHRVMYAVVEFGVQWVFQLIAISREMDSWLTSQGDGSPLSFRHECFLDPSCELVTLRGQASVTSTR